MEWLNYHHLLYFWTVVQEGSVSRAATKLRLSQPTISAQVRMLEQALGQPLFVRKGRAQALTDVGRVVYRYADEIFSVGRELLETLDGRAPGRSHGVDVDDQGGGVLDDGRLYQLVRQHDGVRERTLEISFLDRGAEAYAFTFG